MKEMFIDYLLDKKEVRSPEVITVLAIFRVDRGWVLNTKIEDPEYDYDFDETFEIDYDDLFLWLYKRTCE